MIVTRGAVLLAVVVVVGACAPSAQRGGPAEAIALEPSTWTFAYTEGARCGDGSETGIGLNAVGSSDLLVYFQGGGACWDEDSCLGPVPKAAQIRGGYDEGMFHVELNRVGITWLNRQETTNAFRSADMVFVPYCTGDLHAGDHVATYGEERVHHVGAVNTRLALERARATLPGVERVFLAGASGGAFGTWYAWETAREVFPDAEVHILADSGPPIDVGDELLAAFNKKWHLQHPPGCLGCPERQVDILDYIGSTVPSTRMGLLTYGADPVLADYAAIDIATFEERLRTVVNALEAAGGKVFMVAGSSHVVVSNPYAVAEGEDLPTWTARFVDGDDAWRSVGRSGD